MAKYMVGQTYKAVWEDGSKQSFEVLEQGHDVYSDLYGIRWDDGYEESAYKADMDHWVEAAKEAEELQANSERVKVDPEDLEKIERLKKLRDTYLSNVKALDFAIAKLEKRTLGTANT